MDIFLSYPSTERKLAERLREELSRHGVTVWADSGESKEGWSRRIEEATRSAGDIVVLLSPKQADDPAQQSTWQAALEAVWQKPGKRLVPVLLPGAKLPGFIFSGSSGGKVEAIQIDDPKHLGGVVETILGVLQKKAKVRMRSAFDDRTYPPQPDSGTKGAYPVSVPSSRGAHTFTAEADRERLRSRLSEIRQYAEKLKS